MQGSSSSVLFLASYYLNYNSMITLDHGLFINQKPDIRWKIVLIYETYYIVQTALLINYIVQTWQWLHLKHYSCLLFYRLKPLHEKFTALLCVLESEGNSSEWQAEAILQMCWQLQRTANPSQDGRGPSLHSQGLQLCLYEDTNCPLQHRHSK